MTANLRNTPTPSARQKVLEQYRDQKMARSAHAYVRGSTLQFYKWISARGARAVPAAPSVWICGDCHSGNLGPLAAADGKVYIQIRDLDQTVIGNPNHDLIRLALSLACAARGSDLSGVTTAHMLEQMMKGYRGALRGTGATARGESPKCVRVVMHKAVSRTWKHLARERLKEVRPNIPLGDRFWSLSRNESKALQEVFKRKEVRRLITSLKSRPDHAKVDMVDAAYWMKGCSSLGRLRYAVLCHVQGGDSEDDEFCLVDLKEAHVAAAPRNRRVAMPADNGERVVEGAKHLSPALGGRMLSTRFLGRSMVLRELMPQDLKLEIDQLSSQEAVESARYLAAVVGEAHGRQMDRETRSAFSASLKPPRAAKLDAPSWLWASVVELVASHETAYLEHCRRVALR